MPPTERKLAAILSADVVGYSRLMAEDEPETVRGIKAHRDMMGGLVRQHAGRVVDAVGDNLLAEFASVVDAVSCAVAIQGEIAERSREMPPDRGMRVRIGVNLGDVIVDEDRIYGDGVNLAARIQELSAAGGVAISGTAYDQVEGKLGLEYDDLGLQEVKNLARPVRVYRVRISEEADPGTETTVPGFAGRPAIAVLSFENLSGDPEQEYFADGLAEDLITRLSTWRWFPVIARNSSFVYKGQTLDVRRVSRELGARYIVEGSVRRAGERVRVTAQLIDASTGHHVWAERYDRELQDIFALQDEITEAIVASMNPELRQFETERAARRESENLDAWDSVQRAWWHMFQPGRGRNEKARALYRRAIELDPHSVWAFYGLCMTYVNDVINMTSESREDSLEEAVAAAKRCIELDDQDALGHCALGAAYTLLGRRGENLAAFEVAVELNPSLATGYQWLGTSLAWAGQSEEAIVNCEKAMRLSPKDPMTHVSLHGIALAHFVAGRYEEAAKWSRRSLQHRPDSALAGCILAASLAQAGRLDEATAAIAATFPRARPSLSRVLQNVAHADPDVAERFLEGLRKAGLPEE
jgi:TolB-like protein/Flp pilus assembly protein TadD